MSDPMEKLIRRVEQLEVDNDRLRRQLEGVIGPDNPCFHHDIFLRILRRTTAAVMIPTYVLIGLILLMYLGGLLGGWSATRLGPVPLFDLGGQSSGFRGMGFGIVAFGGFAVGAIAFGGMSFGLIAIGGGAVGVVAIGGGACGLIAAGGGAVGYIAIGGNAFGHYALG